MILTILQRGHSNLFPFSCAFDAPYHLEPGIKHQQPPDLPLEIWLEIFQFATYVHHNVTIKPLDPFTSKHVITNAMGVNTPSLALRTKLALVLVSKSWRNVALQMLYQHLVVRSPARANAIFQVLDSSRISRSFPSEQQVAKSGGYGEWTRHIEVYTLTRKSRDIRYLQTIFKIILLCPNLRMLSGRWIYPVAAEFLNGISQFLGPKLQGLYWNEQTARPLQSYTTNATPEFLGSFQSLRVLDLRYFIGTDSSSWPPISSRPTLPLLQDLILSTYPNVLEIAAFLSLPSLRNLTLRTPSWEEKSEILLQAFLKAHGLSLISVDLTTPSADSELDSDSTMARRPTAAHINPDLFLNQDVCPNLESIAFPVTSPSITCAKHPSLRRIGLRGGNFDGLYPDKASSMKDHLMAINNEKYPNLRLIQIVSFLVEAHTDSIIKDIFIWWADRFETMGVTFLDGECVLWAYEEPKIANAPSDHSSNSSHEIQKKKESKVEEIYKPRY